jgi:GTP-binding protein HflX
LLDRPRSGERALLLHVGLNRPSHEDETQEFRALAESAGAEVVAEVQARRERPDPRFFVGRGKVEEVAARVQESQAELILVSQPLRAGQERNLETTLKTRVLDRNGLILDIFAQRAESRDGKLQVELAQLKYTLPRLGLKDDALSRLTGGIGGRGPGETKLELGRRRARERVNRLEKALEEIEKQRAVRAKRRSESDTPRVAIVGYTNAGKSTILNALTDAGVLAEDKLFATLDPRSRRLVLPTGERLILSDTVGLIRDMPAGLFAAFRATFEEVAAADVLLEVVDASDPEHAEHQESTEKVLADLGLLDRPRLRVFNKADRLSDLERDVLLERGEGVLASAITKGGMDATVTRLAELVREQTGGSPAHVADFVEPAAG